MPENLRVASDLVRFPLRPPRKENSLPPSSRRSMGVSDDTEFSSFVGCCPPLHRGESTHRKGLLSDLPDVEEKKLCDGPTEPVDFNRSSFLFPSAQRGTTAVTQKAAAAMPPQMQHYHHNPFGILVNYVDTACQSQILEYQHLAKVLEIKKDHRALLLREHLETAKKINENAKEASNYSKFCTYLDLLSFAFCSATGAGLAACGISMGSPSVFLHGLSMLAGGVLSMFASALRYGEGSQVYTTMLSLGGVTLAMIGGARGFAIIAPVLPERLAESLYNVPQLLRASLNYKISQTKSAQHLLEQNNTKTNTELQQNHDDIKETLGQFTKHEVFDLCASASQVLHTLNKSILIRNSHKGG